MEDDAYDYDDEQYLPEVDVFNRVVFDDDDSLDKIALEAGVHAENRKKGDMFVSKIWRFYVYVNAAARRLIDEEIIPNISVKEIPIVLKQIKLINNPQYKNPDAFFCGYSVSRNGKIDTKLLEHIVNTSNGAIKNTDILRYGRLWLKTLKKLK